MGVKIQKQFTIGVGFVIFFGATFVGWGTNWKIGAGIFLIAFVIHKVLLVINKNILEIRKQIIFLKRGEERVFWRMMESDELKKY